MTRATADASEVLTLLDGRSDRAAARMAGVSHDTMARWRRTGLAAPHTLAMALQRLASDPTDPTKPIGRPAGSGRVDVHCMKTPDGWMVLGYVAGENNPLQGLANAAQAGQRWPTLEDAHAFAHRRFGRQLAALTPELTP